MRKIPNSPSSVDARSLTKSINDLSRSVDKFTKAINELSDMVRKLTATTKDISENEEDSE